MTELFDPPPTYPDSAVESIYSLYPRKEDKKQGMKRIREALDRICGGEIDGNPRTQAEAIEYLRQRTESARSQMFARNRNFIPHPSTFYHQRRYLQTALPNEALPARLDACVQILAEYPKMPAAVEIGKNIEAFLPALCAIDKALEKMEVRAASAGLTVNHAVRRLTSRTQIYAMTVKDWPAADLQFVPNPKRWFDESRFDHDPSTWQRKSTSNYESERDQISRLVQ